MQLSVHVYLEHSAIKPTRDKEKGITQHFHQSTGVDGLNGLYNCQRESGLPPAPPHQHDEDALELRS